jgi:DNA-binding transcriptional ArsR family regulator
MFGIDRTANTRDDLVVDVQALLADALAQVGLESHVASGSEHGVDLVLEVDGAQFAVQVKSRSLVDEDIVRRLLAEPRSSSALVVVVADRVTDAARRLLTARRGGYLDLRGRLALRAEGIVIDVEVDPVKPRAERTDALSGNAGLEVAAALLMHPGRAPGVRELARDLARSPSTVSEILTALRRSGLIEDDNSVDGTELFWQVADRWPARRIRVMALPAASDPSITKAVRLGLTDVEHETGWALTDSAAAVAYGAPLAVRSGQALDFFVPDEAIVRRAVTLLGHAASPSEGSATVRVAPVPAVVRQRVDLRGRGVEWPLAHPVFVALDLAQDQGRGREILEAWTPDDRWTRVW